MEKIKLHKRTEDLTGRVFGKLTVLKFAEYKLQTNGNRVACWLCKCECGNNKTIFASNLKTNSSLSCGNCNPVHIGDIFGKLIVIGFAEPKLNKNNTYDTMWLCKCTCGNIKTVDAHSLKKGATKSCGNCNPIKIRDNFGKLTVIEFAGYKINKNGYRLQQWLCGCECGNKTTVLANSLKTGYTLSCGNCNPINIGDVFGKLTVMEFAGYEKASDGKNRAQWLCRCECGNKKITSANDLKTGSTNSCGCFLGGYSKKYNFSYDSLWELNFVKILEYLEVEWQREPKTFELSNGKKYIPDFYLPEFNMFIEIKGWWREDENGFSISREKTELFKKEYTQYSYYIIDTPKYRAVEKKFKFLL